MKSGKTFDYVINDLTDIPVSVSLHRKLYLHTMLTLSLPDQICNSPYCRPYNSYNVSSENLVLDQPNYPQIDIFFILITHLVDTVLIL